MNFRKIFYKSQLYFKKQSSTILTYIGAVGVVVTSIATAKATIKANHILEDLEKRKESDGKPKTFINIVTNVVPVYIPTVIFGASTIVCIFGANVLNRKQQASLISAYALANNYHKEYRDKLIELYGQEADIKVRNAMAREHCNYHQIGLDVPDGKVVFYDEISGKSILRYEREIMDAEYHLNRNFTMRGYAFLNEFYEFLGLPMSEYGGTVGWSMASGIMWIDFEHRLIDKKGDSGLPLYSIDMVFTPDILEEWEC